MLELFKIIESLSRQRPIFHNEADFQHALAWEIRNHYPNSKIRLEMKVHGSDIKVYLDILVLMDGHKYGIELKYKTRKFEGVIDGEKFALNHHGAHDIGRYDVIKDLQRLEQMVSTGVIEEGFLVFLSNDPSYYADSVEEKQTADRDFRLYEGRRLQNKLFWGEHTGQGTMKGREEPLSLQGRYDVHWVAYSSLSDKPEGEFRYLLLSTKDQRINSISPIVQDVDIPQLKHGNEGVSQLQSGQQFLAWFDSFAKQEEIPLSQIDLRDKLANHLRHMGYSVSINRELGQDKVDIWAQSGSEHFAVEVRYKTALLQTIYKGKSIHLKNQAAHDISRYDFVSDIGKLERVVRNRPDVHGFALLITNDSLYWQPSKKSNSVDELFRLHHGRLLMGVCAWKEEAGYGTTTGREALVHLDNTYHLAWQPYCTLGTNKNETFQALLVEVISGT
jgi:hypothetical protein